MTEPQNHIAMIQSVARALGESFCREFAFVGGCTTSLLLTDAYAHEQVRHTDDVDLIVSVLGWSGWYDTCEKLKAKGFKESMEEGDPICAMRLNGLRVDFMPDDPAILGFSNEWYGDALRSAAEFELPGALSIRLVRPEYFLATKLAAYRGRGNEDPLESRDIEDILALIDGRPELMEELLQSPAKLRRYVSKQLSDLSANSSFEYAVQAASNGNSDREALLWDRLALAISYADLS